MLVLSDSEILFYSGIAIIVFSILLFIVCMIFFNFKWKRLKKKLEQEYGVLKR